MCFSRQYTSNQSFHYGVALECLLNITAVYLYQPHLHTKWQEATVIMSVNRGNSTITFNTNQLWVEGITYDTKDKNFQMNPAFEFKITIHLEIEQE